MSSKRLGACILLALALSGCARPDFSHDPRIRIETTVLRRDVESLDIVRDGNRLEYAISGLSTVLYYYERPDGSISIAQITKQPERRTLLVPAAGARVETTASSGGLSVSSVAHLDGNGVLPDDGPSLVEQFMAETGAIPGPMDVRREVSVGSVFTEDKDIGAAGWAADADRVPATRTIAERIPAQAVDAAVKDAAIREDDPRYRKIYAEKAGTPLARLLRADLRDKEGAAKYRKLLSMLPRCRESLGEDRTGILERRYRAGLERALYAQILESGDTALLGEYASLFGRDKSLSRLGELRRRFDAQPRKQSRAEMEAALDEAVERARAESKPAILDEFAKSVRSASIARRARRERASLARELAAAEQDAKTPDGRRVETRPNGSAENVAVHSRPTSHSDVLTVLKAGGSYPLKSVKGGYYQIEYEPDRYGFIHRQFVRLP